MDYRKRRQTTMVILHHSHTDGSEGDIMPWLEANGRVKGLLDIGYHGVIGLDGTFHAARSLDTVGSHTPGFNEESIGICLEGKVAISEEQMHALRFLWSVITHTYGPVRLLAHTELGRHKRRNATFGGRCPNINMDYIRARLGATTHTTEPPKEDPHVEPEKTPLSPQQTIVLNLLKAGRTITNKLAAACYGVGDLPKRISELRAMGYEIDREWDSEDFRGTEVRFLKYKLPPRDPDGNPASPNAPKEA